MSGILDQWAGASTQGGNCRRRSQDVCTRMPLLLRSEPGKAYEWRDPAGALPAGNSVASSAAVSSPHCPRFGATIVDMIGWRRTSASNAVAITCTRLSLDLPGHRLGISRWAAPAPSSACRRTLVIEHHAVTAYGCGTSPASRPVNGHAGTRENIRRDTSRSFHRLRPKLRCRTRIPHLRLGGR